MPSLSVSHNEMLQLHLLAMEPFRGEIEVPKEASQEGISEKMGSGLHNISRALSAMTSDGLVESRLCHVRGAPKRRKAYFLTGKGLSTAQALVKDLGTRPITFDDGRAIRIVPLAVAMKSYEDRTGQKPNLWDFVENARNNGTLRLEDIVGQARGMGTTGERVTMSFGRPMVEVFEGRIEELGQLTEFVRSSEVTCALVVGLPGIGKSTLASKIFESIKTERSELWYSVHEWDSVQSVIRMLISFFPPPAGDRFPDLEQEWELADFFTPLIVSLRETRPIIFLDDVDRATPSVSVLLGLICDAVVSAPSSKIILISRTVPQFLVPGSAKVRQVDLKCLDQKSSVALAGRWEADDPNRAVEESGGHPLMLRLACEIGTTAARGSIEDILSEHFQKVLNDQEKRLLEFLSVMRLPVPAKELPGFSADCMSTLKHKGLVQEFAEGISVHQVVRTYFNSQLTSGEAVRLHRIAAEVCHVRTGDRWRLEEVSQDLSAGDWEAAIEVLIGNSEVLIANFAEESLQLVASIPHEQLDAVPGGHLAYMKGRLHHVLGRTHEALGDFQTSLALLGPDQNAMRAMVQENYARAQSEQNLISESLETHRLALSYYEGTNDRAGQIREWMGIGSAWRKGRGVVESKEAFLKALEIARELNDLAAVAAGLNNLALLEWEQGELKEAEADLRESINTARLANDTIGEGTGQTNLADLYLVQLREKESENLRLESAETFRRSGDIVQFKMIKARWAMDVTRSGRGAEAAASLEEVIGPHGRTIRMGRGRRPDYVDEGDLALLRALIGVHRATGGLGKAMNAVETLKRMAKDMDRPDLEAQAEMEGALNEEELGGLPRALGHLKRAEVLLRELGNSEGLGAVYLRMGLIHLQTGDRDESLIELREAVRHSERSGNQTAYAAALEELGEALGSVSLEGREYLEKAKAVRRTAGRTHRDPAEPVKERRS